MAAIPSVPIRVVPQGDPALTELALVEEAAGRIFEGVLDAGVPSAGRSGTLRAAQPGFVLVAGDPVIGFAHVLDLDGHAHLAQLSVDPRHHRRGVGRALVTAAMHECRTRGHDEVSLSTFADVPWNAPFFRQMGFRDVDDARLPPVVAQLRQRERAAGLDDAGPRVTMRVPLARTVVEPRPAVSVIPVRDAAMGVEVFVQHRQATMDFAAGAVVFPGGRCDAADIAAGAGIPLPCDVLEEHVRRWAATSPDAGAREARTLLATGLRELQEETGMVAEPTALVPWDRWVTPEIVPKRFDVAFYVMHVPRDAANQPEHSTTEATHSGWESVTGLLEGLETGRVTMLTPTRVIVEELAGLGSVDAIMALRPAITTVRDDRPDGRPRPGAEPRTVVREPWQER